MNKLRWCLCLGGTSTRQTKDEQKKGNAQWREMQIGSAWKAPAVSPHSTEATLIWFHTPSWHTHPCTGLEARAWQLIKKQVATVAKWHLVQVNTVISQTLLVKPTYSKGTIKKKKKDSCQKLFCQSTLLRTSEAWIGSQRIMTRMFPHAKYSLWR